MNVFTSRRPHHADEAGDVEPDVVADGVGFTDGGEHGEVRHVAARALHPVVELQRQVVAHVAHGAAARPAPLPRVVEHTPATMTLDRLRTSSRFLYFVLYFTTNGYLLSRFDCGTIARMHLEQSWLAGESRGHIFDSDRENLHERSKLLLPCLTVFLLTLP